MLLRLTIISDTDGSLSEEVNIKHAFSVKLKRKAPTYLRLGPLVKSGSVLLFHTATV